jgi:hypothetical protein
MSCCVFLNFSSIWLLTQDKVCNIEIWVCWHLKAGNDYMYL